MYVCMTVLQVFRKTTEFCFVLFNSQKNYKEKKSQQKWGMEKLSTNYVLLNVLIHLFVVNKISYHYICINILSEIFEQNEKQVFQKRLERLEK